MTKIRSRKAAALLLAASASPVLFATSARAQESASTNPGTEEPVALHRFVVTGSNIPNASEEPALPLSVFSRAKIETMGVQTTSDLLQMIPQVVGSGNYRGEQVSNPGGGEATVALRGLPASSTLVLVNGRRVALTSAISLSNSAVNINTIPLAAVARVEVLREGAGPIYGSDAIAGVVNIILHDNYRGGQITTEFGNTTNKDAATRIASFLLGTGTDKTNVVFSGSYFKSNAVYSRDRDIVTTADYRKYADVGGGDLRSSSAPRGRIFTAAAPGGVVYDGQAGGTGAGAADYHAFTSADRYDFRQITTEVLPQERYGFTLNARHRLSQSVNLIAEAGYTHISSVSDAAPTPLFSDSEPFQDLAGNIVQMTIPINNIHNPFGAGSSDGLYAVDAVYKRFTELGPRTTITDVDNIRTLIGLEGMIDNRWSWEAAGLYSRDHTTNINKNLVNKGELFAQLQNSNPAIASVNVFGSPEFNTRDAAQTAALERLRLNAVNDSSYELSQVDIKANGTIFDLPAGPLALAGGLEARREELNFTPDSAITSFNTIGSTNQRATFGSRNVKSAYLELSVPLLARLPGIYSLEASIAGRFEDYSDFGTTTKPGFSLRWKPFGESFAVRGSYSAGFRAANLQELYLGGQESFEDLENPNAPDQIQVRNLQSGNPNLEPEESKSWNIGAIYSPPAVEGLSFRIDYFSIFKTNNIGVLEAQFVFDQFLAGDPTFADAVDINPVNQFATAIRTPYSNLGKEITRGFDYGITYELPTEQLGKFTFTVDGTYLQTYLFTPDKASDYLESAGDYNNAVGNALPRNRGSFSTLWDYQKFTVSLAWNYIWGLREDLGDDESHKIDDWNTFDFTATYNVGRGWKVGVGVINFLDEAPPFVANAGSNGYSNETHDILGRNYYVRLIKQF